VVFEGRRLAREIQDETAPAPAGPIVVSGMLGEQLARELAAGAEPGAVVVDGQTRLSGAEVVVHVIARPTGTVFLSCWCSSGRRRTGRRPSY
jgi:hypothetical protein